jgi:hypothetical protein
MTYFRRSEVFCNVHCIISYTQYNQQKIIAVWLCGRSEIALRSAASAPSHGGGTIVTSPSGCGALLVRAAGQRQPRRRSRCFPTGKFWFTHPRNKPGSLYLNDMGQPHQVHTTVRLKRFGAARPRQRPAPLCSRNKRLFWKPGGDPGRFLPPAGGGIPPGTDTLHAQVVAVDHVERLAFAVRRGFQAHIAGLLALVLG